VYALVLVLVEAVTGTVPFAADTTIATLMARLDGPIPVPGALGPLGDVLSRAGALDPAERIGAGVSWPSPSMAPPVSCPPRTDSVGAAGDRRLDDGDRRSDATGSGSPKSPPPGRPPANGHVKDEPATQVFDALSDPTLALDLAGPPIAAPTPARPTPARLTCERP